MGAKESGDDMVSGEVKQPFVSVGPQSPLT
jgi:hypothetical protein